MSSHYQALFAQLADSNCLVLTVNQRLAATLRQEYQLQQAGIRHIWQSAKCLPINTWLHSCWQQCYDLALVPSQLLLSPEQEQALWCHIIEQSSHGGHLLRIYETAQQVQSAWHYLQQWQLPLAEVDACNDDVSAFLQWAQAFEEKLAEQSWLVNSQIANVLLHVEPNRSWQAFDKIILYGFDQVVPQVQQLLTKLQQHDCQVEYYNIPANSNENYYTVCDDDESEIYDVANWVRQTLQTNDEQSLACIVPNLNERREQIKNIFSKVLQPHQYLFRQIDEQHIEFDFSIGIPLANYPLTEHAFLILQLLQQALPYQKMCALLTSPFLSDGETELSMRANLEAQLRGLNHITIDLNTVIAYASVDTMPKYGLFCHAPLLSKALTQFQQFANQLSHLQTVSQWAQTFKQALALLGWPGQRSLNSEEYQIAQRIEDLLSEFAQLSTIVSALSLNSALLLLRQMAVNIIFQPQAKPCQIHILGLLEASGLFFDQCWVMGFDDKQWPPEINPNPYLPITLQRQHHFPHASQEHELELCQTITERLKQCAQKVIFSHIQQRGDQRFNLTPLLSTTTLLDFQQSLNTHKTNLEQLIFDSKALDPFCDQQGPLLNLEESIIGGSGILKEQAACAFKAFAKYRLRAESLAEPSIGLNALTRGSIIHRVLEYAWRDLKDHETLCEQSTEQLQALCQRAISNTLAEFISDKQPNLYQLESQRLLRLLTQWLTLEKERSPFKIKALEDYQEITINGLVLHLRVDRIDELSDGRLLIIDYKTGHVDINAWFSERPDDPQLPLYCMSGGDHIEGLSFAQVRSNKVQFKGICEYTNTAPGIVTANEIKIDGQPLNWEQQNLQWHTVLTSLANDFINGQAAVEPKDPNMTCRYCDLHMLCRIYEQEQL